MKNTRKVLSAVLALVMVLGCMTAFTFSSAAEETPVNLAPNHAESMIMITRGDKADGLAEFTDGVIDDKDAGFWTLDMVKNAVKKGKITKAEFEEITGVKYS